MRYSRMVGPPKRGRKGANLVLFVVILGITVYLVGAGAAGGWLAENVINPVFNNSTESPSPLPTQAETTQAAQTNTPDQSPNATASTARLEEQITARNIALYTLQAGAFSSESNAKMAANEISTRGGAGYVAYDGSLYRALIAGYTQEADATSVKTELANQGIASTVFLLESGALEFKIGAEPAQIDTVKACFDIVPQTVDALQQIIYDADKGENVDERISALRSEAEQAATQLKNAISSNTDALVRLSAYMDSFCKTLADIPASTNVTSIAFSSSLKYNIISIVVDYSSFLKDLSG